MTNNQIHKLSKYFKLTIIILFISVLLGGAIFFTQFNSFMGGSAGSTLYKNDMYMLYGEPTDYQKDLFRNLTNELNKTDKDELQLVALVVQNFVADFYTWTNKAGAFDIGGKDFVFANEFTNFNSHARRYIYSDMSIYLGKGIPKSELNEVIDVEIIVSDYAYYYDYYGKQFDTFYVEAKWTYKETASIDISAFPTQAAFTIIKTEEGRYEIARFY